MRNRWTLLLAASLGVTGMSLMVGCDQDSNRNAYNAPPATRPNSDMRASAAADRTDNAVDRTKNAADSSNNAAQQAGEHLGGAIPSSKGLSHNMLADITNAALTKGGFDDLVERLSKNDRDRLHDYANGKNFDDLDAKVAQLQADFKAKYNHDFDINHQDQVFNQMVQFSEVKKEGYNTGTITIPASHDLPALTFNLESSGTAWKLDIPDTITGSQLKSNLMGQLDTLDKDKANWPSDMNEAYRLFAHHVLMALSGK